MKLERISIHNFRSIEDCMLSNIGGFNVLIGKNNSGKSNILTALNTFFIGLRDGNVTFDPPFGEEIDFFDRRTNLPIEIGLTFSLSLAERDALIQDIVTEAPQMKNAVEGIDPSLRLCTTIRIVRSKIRFGYVHKLALGSHLGEKGYIIDKNILLLENDAALELHERLSRFRKRNNEAREVSKLLRYMDEDEWANFMNQYKSEGKTRSLRNFSRRFYYRGSPGEQLSDEAIARFEAIISEAPSYDEFRRSINVLSTQMQEEAAATQSETIKNKIGTFAGDESLIPKYVRNLLAKIYQNKVLYLTERRNPIGKEEAQRLLQLKVRRGGPEVLRSIQDTISSLLSVNIDAFESASPRREEQKAELDVDNFLVEVNGSGIREALRIILDYELEHPTVLLVEEPEIHLHPALEISMMRYLSRISSDCQVFISTHSTNFLDESGAEKIFLISKSISTSSQLLDFKQAESQIPKELGIRLSSLFMFDRLVFVEGVYDEEIFRELASLLQVNLSKSNVGFITMGGVRNFTHFAAESTLSFLTKRRVKMWFFLDRDEKGGSDIVKFQEKAKENVFIKVLKRREIENYFISPRAIIEFIKLKKELSGKNDVGKLPSESEVGKMIETCAENLKGLAIDKRVANI